jgi:hypothetical protein
VLSLALLVAALVAGVGTFLALLCGVALMGTVIVAVHHAEVVAHGVGETLWHARTCLGDHRLGVEQVEDLQSLAIYVGQEAALRVP